MLWAHCVCSIDGCQKQIPTGTTEIMYAYVDYSVSLFYSAYSFIFYFLVFLPSKLTASINVSGSIWGGGGQFQMKETPHPLCIHSAAIRHLLSVKHRPDIVLDTRDKAVNKTE